MKRVYTQFHACTVDKLPQEAVNALTSSGDYCRHGVFACGIYELEEGPPPIHKGQIELYSADEGQRLGYMAMDSGVLDVSWAADHNLAACALSSGELHVLRAAPDFALEDIASIAMEDEGYFLSTAWGNDVRSVATSTQEGSLVLYDLAEGGLRELLHLPGVHHMMGSPMPAWTVAFDPHCGGGDVRLASGGDDMALRLWDVRDASSAATPASANTKVHTAGVTYVAWHPMRPHLLASGSYDEHVRLWDDRQLKTPVAECHTGGGIWRLEWSRNSFLAAACMHSGSKVMRVTGSCATEDASKSASSVFTAIEMAEMTLSVEETYKFNDNENVLNYGMAILGVNEEGDTRFASSSFYENVIDLWSVKLPLDS